LCNKKSFNDNIKKERKKEKKPSRLAQYKSESFKELNARKALHSLALFKKGDNDENDDEIKEYIFIRR
jgi:hypothetical protein